MEISSDFIFVLFVFFVVDSSVGPAVLAQTPAGAAAAVVGIKRNDLRARTGVKLRDDIASHMFDQLGVRLAKAPAAVARLVASAIGLQSEPFGLRFQKLIAVAQSGPGMAEGRHLTAESLPSRPGNRRLVSHRTGAARLPLFARHAQPLQPRVGSRLTGHLGPANVTPTNRRGKADVQVFDGNGRRARDHHPQLARPEIVAPKPFEQLDRGVQGSARVTARLAVSRKRRNVARRERGGKSERRRWDSNPRMAVLQTGDLPRKTRGKTGIPGDAGANAGAVETKRGQSDPDLQGIIDAWADLPEAIRAGIVAMVRAASGEY